MPRTLRIALVVCVALPLLVAAWLRTVPPDLLRIGTGYAAKAVCSHVFVAGRDRDEVLRDDVQSPGHPLLRFVSVRVDRDEEWVRAVLFGFAAPVEAVHRPGFGCAVVPDGDTERARAQHPDPPPTGAGSRFEWETDDLTGVSELLRDRDLVGPGLRAALVVHRGLIVGERYGEGFGASTPLLGWSMTKTVTGALVGTLVREGLLSLDEADLLEGWRGDRRARITLADLLGMESGLAFRETYGGVADVTRMLFLEPDMAAFAARSPAEAPPGERYNYSSGTSLLINRIWQSRFDDPADARLWPRRALFGPLGMETAVLETDARGTFVGSSYLWATARDWARFGQFLLQDGVWEEEEILPPGFAARMRERVPSNGNAFGRGHLWLRGPDLAGAPHPDEARIPADAFWLMGHDGQYMAVVPSLELIVLRMGLTPEVLGYRPQPLVAAVVELVAARGMVAVGAEPAAIEGGRP
jgi:CubicO group peptidase (beta-lactamase class C family)